ESVESGEGSKEADFIGLAFTKIPVDPGVGVLAFRPLGKGRGTVRQTTKGPELPTGDGAIIAIKTYGMNTRDVLRKLEGNESLFGGFHFVTPDTKTDWPAL